MQVTQHHVCLRPPTSTDSANKPAIRQACPVATLILRQGDLPSGPVSGGSTPARPPARCAPLLPVHLASRTRLWGRRLPVMRPAGHRPGVCGRAAVQSTPAGHDGAQGGLSPRHAIDGAPRAPAGGPPRACAARPWNARPAVSVRRDGSRPRTQLLGCAPFLRGSSPRAGGPGRAPWGPGPLRRSPEPPHTGL